MTDSPRIDSKYEKTRAERRARVAARREAERLEEWLAEHDEQKKEKRDA